jgi:cytochrome c biogenesis protein CcmG/thiol:disulfide interchange protein DsbE
MSSLLLLPLLVVANATRPQVGEPVPTFQARTLAGQSVRSEELPGHVTVVDFFATWCQPCQEGLSEILAVRRRLRPRFDLLIVAVEGDVPALRDFFASHPFPARTTVALDRDGALARAFGEDRLPTTFFLDDKATIRHINRGHGSGFRVRSTRWLTELLGDSP